MNGCKHIHLIRDGNLDSYSCEECGDLFSVMPLTPSDVVMGTEGEKP